MNKRKLELTSEMWIFFTFQQGLAPSWQHVGCQCLCQPIDRGSEVMLVFLEEKLKVPITGFSLIWIRFKIVPTRSTKWKRLDIQNFKPCHKRNGRSKFLEKQKQNIPTKWDKSWCMIGHNQQNFFPDFFKVWHTFQTFESLFCEIFYCTNVLQIACASLKISEGRFACLTLCLVLVTK